nr:hypothetical protein [uncultured Niameybacter sp.]
MEPLFFIKFGEREHLESLVSGEVYISNAKTFIQLEEEQLNKGQGDKMEGKYTIEVSNLKLISHETGEEVPIKQVLSKVYPMEVVEKILAQENIRLTLNFPDLINYPVFCLTWCDTEDCEYYIDEENYKVKLSETIQEEIITSFPRANAALIITNPKAFIGNMEEMFGTCQHDRIHYYDYSINDKAQIDYLVPQGGGMKQEDLYRHLLTKDIYFKEQKEYRFIGLGYQIESPQLIPIRALNERDYVIVDLEELWKGVVVSK